jgi:aerobic-type carbon monoxide dehydrogenase small subunit (CoxS/CutS family)
VAEGRSEFRAVVNGRSVAFEAAPLEPLVTVLRRELGLFGVRETCGLGLCGTCTILLDGRPVSSCLLPSFAVEGRTVVTVEGLGGREALHPVQEAFVEEQAFQCSFCTPGFILAATALLAESDEAPSSETVEEYLGGHLCRCGSYRSVIDALRAAYRKGTARAADPPEGGVLPEREYGDPGARRTAAAGEAG